MMNIPILILNIVLALTAVTASYCVAAPKIVEGKLIDPIVPERLGDLRSRDRHLEDGPAHADGTPRLRWSGPQWGFVRHRRKHRRQSGANQYLVLSVPVWYELAENGAEITAMKLDRSCHDCPLFAFDWICETHANLTGRRLHGK